MVPPGLTPAVAPDADDTVDTDSMRNYVFEPDDDEYFFEVTEGPFHGALSYFDDIDGDSDLDGGFIYTADYPYAGADYFSYKAIDVVNPDPAESDEVTVFIEILPIVNLTIHHGQSGDPVPDNIEETVGGFTVANGNDTDGDGVWDHIDEDGVLASDYGRDEVDLMELVIDKPIPDQGGYLSLSSVDYGAIRFWNESTKVIELLPDGNGEIQFPTSVLPATVWVEVTTPSTAIGDRTIEATYGLAGDTVKATGVWVSITSVSHDTKSAAELFAPGTPWEDMTDPPRDLAENTEGGTGLRPIVAGKPVRHAIWMRFQVAPDGIWNHANVRFDVTRRREWGAWKIDSSQNVVKAYLPFPKKTEHANDDSLAGDETNEPDADGYMWSVDAPRLVFAPDPGQALAVVRNNMEEFVRVSFDGGDPTFNGVKGSRASGRFLWHATHRLEPDGAGWWQRTTGDQEVLEINDVDVQPPHVEIENYDPLNP